MTIDVRFLLASLALSVPLIAGSESAYSRSASGRSLGSIVAVLDSNGDGTLSVTEIAAAPLALTALDLDDDGIISPAERRAGSAEGRLVHAWRGATAYTVLFTLDANHDGDLQSMEISNAVSSLKRLDLNGDGALTPAELRPSIVARN